MSTLLAEEDPLWMKGENDEQGGPGAMSGAKGPALKTLRQHQAFPWLSWKIPELHRVKGGSKQDTVRGGYSIESRDKILSVEAQKTMEKGRDLAKENGRKCHSWKSSPCRSWESSPGDWWLYSTNRKAYASLGLSLPM